MHLGFRPSFPRLGGFMAATALEGGRADYMQSLLQDRSQRCPPGYGRGCADFDRLVARCCPQRHSARDSELDLVASGEICQAQSRLKWDERIESTSWS